MKTLMILSMLTAAIGAPVMAQAPQAVSEVRVGISPDLAEKTRILDDREFKYLTRELKRTVEKRLDRAGALRPDGGELYLVIEDATPNRPTMRQMSQQPGLSYSSFGVGGARISGEYRARSGETTPVRYSWYETDIRRTPYYGAWSDADRAFERLADKLARGETQ
jgi:hypothetical protein